MRTEHEGRKQINNDHDQRFPPAPCQPNKLVLQYISSILCFKTFFFPSLDLIKRGNGRVLLLCCCYVVLSSKVTRWWPLQLSSKSRSTDFNCSFSFCVFLLFSACSCVVLVLLSSSSYFSSRIPYFFLSSSHTHFFWNNNNNVISIIMLMIINFLSLLLSFSSSPGLSFLLLFLYKKRTQKSPTIFTIFASSFPSSLFSFFFIAQTPT